MADVRSLLRSERASRRIQHAHASYSTAGTLGCLVCHIPLKAESLWELHLKSADHVKRLQRLRDGQLERPPSGSHSTVTESGRKRKAESDDDVGQERKKVKPAVEGVPPDFFDGDKGADKDEVIEDVEEREMVQEKAPEVVDMQSAKTQSASLPPGFFDPSEIRLASAITTVDEDEWAAFERDVATLPAETAVPSALTATATIIAAPLSAAELAARTTAEESTQKTGLKDAELEGEKEDAARQLEDEFDQMEELENRVRRLRAKREELRQKRESGGTVQVEMNDVRLGTDLNDDERAGAPDDDDDDEDVDDEWDHWRLKD